MVGATIFEFCKGLFDRERLIIERVLYDASERYQQFSFQNELEIKFQMRLTHRSLNKNNQ